MGVPSCRHRSCPAPIIHAPTCPLPPIPHPIPSFLRRQEPPIQSPPPSPIHPSPLPGGRLGGGWDTASRRHRSCPAPIIHATSCPLPLFPHPLRHPSSLRHSCAPLRHFCAPSVIPAQAGTARTTELRPASDIRRRSNLTWAGRRDGVACADSGGRLGSCLRRNDGKGRGMAEKEAAWVVVGEGGSAMVRRSRPRTPHLTSPLEGGRDELGKERVMCGWVPAYAGMTERAGE